MNYLLASTSLTDTIFYRTNCSIGKHYALCFELNKFKTTHFAPLVDIVQTVLTSVSPFSRCQRRNAELPAGFYGAVTIETSAISSANT